MQNIYSRKFASKSRIELEEIIQSSKYTNGAKKAAYTLLQNQHNVEPSNIFPHFNSLTINSALEHLKRYGYNVEYTKNNLKIFQNERKNLTGISLFYLGVFGIISTFFISPQFESSIADRYIYTFSISAIIMGWKRMGTYDFHEININQTGICIETGRKNKKSILNYKWLNFKKFIVKKNSNNYSIYADLGNKAHEFILKLDIKEFESTESFAYSLTNQLNILTKNYCQQ